MEKQENKKTEKKKVVRSPDQKTIALSLPVWFYDELKGIADKKGQSLSGIVRFALSEYFGIERR